MCLITQSLNRKSKTKTKGEMHSSTIIVEDINAPIPIVSKTTRQKTNKEVVS